MQSLEAHPEWRIPFLRALGLEALLPLPEKLEAYQQENRERFDRLENAVAQLAEGLNELHQTVRWSAKRC